MSMITHFEMQKMAGVNFFFFLKEKKTLKNKTLNKSMKTAFIQQGAVLIVYIFTSDEKVTADQGYQ